MSLQGFRAVRNVIVSEDLGHALALKAGCVLCDTPHMAAFTTIMHEAGYALSIVSINGIDNQ